MWSRLRGVGLWFVTGFDDVVVERFWGRLRRGDVAGAFRVWSDVILGFWGCGVVLVLGVAVVVAAVLVAR